MHSSKTHKQNIYIHILILTHIYKLMFLHGLSSSKNLIQKQERQKKIYKNILQFLYKFTYRILQYITITKKTILHIGWLK